MKVLLTSDLPASWGGEATDRIFSISGMGTGRRNVHTMQLVIGCVALVAIICITACRSPGERLEVKKPLYEDESGWMIWSCLPGTEVTGRYSRLLDRFRDDGITPPDDFAPAFDYMLWHSPEQFYCFVLVIPETITTYWSPRSSVTMTFRYKDEAYEVTSTEFLITDRHQKIVIHSYEIEGLAPIPNSAYEICSTPKGNPIVFVKFPLRYEPEKILSVTVSTVNII